MSPYEVACKDLADSVEGSFLCGVIELPSGKVLALHCAGGVSPTLESAFSRSSLELLRGPSSQLFGSEDESQHGNAEVQVVTSHTCQIAKTLGDGARALVLVARKDINVGLGWAEVKVTAASLERAGS